MAENEKTLPGAILAAEASQPAAVTGISRRSLLIQGGLAAVALSLPVRSVAALTGPVLEPATPEARRKPLLGALYKADYRSSGEHWTSVREIPALGLYDSSLDGTMDAHLMMALHAGLSFFVVPYSAARAIDDSISHLLARSEMHGWMKVGVLIEPDEDSRMLARARRTGVLRHEEYVEHTADWLLGRFDAIDELGWFDHAGYLRDAEGHRLSGFFSWDAPDAMVAVVERALARRPALAREHRLWNAGTQDVSSHRRLVARAAEREEISWFALHPELERGWQHSLSLYRGLARGSQRVIAVSPAYTGAQNPELARRDAGERLARQLRAVQQLRPAPTHVVINSFNDWRNGTAVEASVKGDRYLKVIADWSASWV